MKCIVVCEPMASALLYGGKDVENRKRFLPIFGPTLILAGKSLDWFTGPYCQWVHERWPICSSSPLMALHQFKPRMGKIIGAIDFGNPYKFDQTEPGAAPPTRWATGPACHPVLDRMAFSKPFPWRGQQGAFTVPYDMLPVDVQAALDGFGGVKAPHPL